MPRYTIVLDKHFGLSLFDAVIHDASFISAALVSPRLKYIGEHSGDEDYYHVLQLAWENDALLITGDAKMLQKARIFGRCRSHNHYRSGVIVLPPGNDRRVELLRSLVDGRLPVLNVDTADDPLEVICDANLGVDLMVKQPVAIELCECPWIDDEHRRRKRYKRK